MKDKINTEKKLKKVSSKGFLKENERKYWFNWK